MFDFQLEVGFVINRKKKLDRKKNYMYINIQTAKTIHTHSHSQAQHIQQNLSEKKITSKSLIMINIQFTREDDIQSNRVH